MTPYRQVPLAISERERPIPQAESEKLAFLRGVPLFASLSEEELLRVCQGFESKKVPRGAIICKEGDPGDCFYIIRSGAAIVSTLQEGKEKTLNELHRGDVFGEMALLTGEPRSATVRALLDMDLLVLCKSSFDAIVREYPLVTMYLSRIISHRLIRASSPMLAVSPPFSYSVIGAEKGVGASTFAREVAGVLSSEAKKRVLVIDLETEGTGEAPELAPIPVPDSQLLDEIDSHYRELFVQSWFKHPSGYALFSVPIPVGRRAISHLGTRLSFFLGILKRKFDYMIFDLPPLLDALSQRALRLSDRVLIVAANAPEGIEKARKRLSEIKEIVGDSACSTIQVGLSRLSSTRGLPGSQAKDVLQISKAPEVWIRAQERHPAETEAQTMSGARRVAREIAGVRIGLALGAGGARGWAHLGVLDALEREDIPIDMIAGSSIGALVGAVYAKKGSFQEAYELIIENFPNKRTTKKRIYDYTVPFRGFIKGGKVLEMVQQGLEGADFLDLKIPLAVVAVDIGNGEEVVLDSGPVADAVRASMAIPGVFEPANYQGRWLVDGAVLNSVPASVLLRKGMNSVIGVCLSSRRAKAEWDPARGPHIINVLTRSYDIIRSQTSEGISELVNVPIYPPIDEFRWDDFHRGQELTKIGREAAYAVMDKIKALLP
jgi:NTE family protein